VPIGHDAGILAGSAVPACVLYSSRTLPDVIYGAELDQHPDGVQVTYTLTRSPPPGWAGHTGRVDTALLGQVAWPAANPLAFICGPTSFVETVVAGLVGLDYPPERLKTERLGATGGLMEALDGNAIGSMLIDVFGGDMTAASSSCGASRPVRAGARCQATGLGIRSSAAAGRLPPQLAAARL
jgi:ferredoxin-NADP reductase